MNVPHPQKVISISQIVNRSQARYKIRFNSTEEFENPEFWRQIIKRRAAYAHYEAIVVDHTPKEDIDGLKKFSILYGLKYLFAAEMLNLDIIPVRVLNHPEYLDSRIVTEFFNVDYLSMPSYEKGMFVDQLRKKRNLTYDQLASKTGFTFSALQNMGQAYTIGRKFPALGEAYRQGKVTVPVMLRSGSLFESTSNAIHQQMTDFIVKNGKYAYELLRETISNNRKETFVNQAVLNAIASAKGQKPVEHDLVSQIIMNLNAEGANISEDKQKSIAEKMEENKKYSIQMQSYQTIHKNCWEAYKSLCAILPENLILDYDTALTLPDRTQFSYAVPSKMKKLCRNKTPQDINGRRLFSRIMEYVVKAGKNLSEEEIFKLTSDFYDNYYNQRQFSKFFRFSILYRNFRDKVISEVQSNSVE